MDQIEAFDELSFDLPVGDLVDFDVDLGIDLDEIISDDEFVPAKTKKRRVTKNYINNEDFIAALVQYKTDCAVAIESGNRKPRIPNYIGECFMKIADGLARKPNFFGYTFKDEMKADAIENCLLYFENFDPTKIGARSGKINAFAYFTQIQFFCFLRRIQKESRQQYVKYKATEMFGILDEAELMELGNGQVKQLEVYESMYDFIQKFEEAELKKKSAKPPKKRKLMGIETFLEG